MCAGETPLLVINQPRKLGDRWIITGKLFTPYGVIELRAEGSELLARKAIERMHGEAMEVAGIFDDIRGAVSRIAKSKAFKQVFSTAKSVMQNPLFRGIASKIPIVSSVVDGADAAFAVADGLASGKLDAQTIVNKASKMLASSNPALAKQGGAILQQLNVASTASALFKAFNAGDKKARRKVRALRRGAKAGDPAQAAAYKALQAARRFTLREQAANVVRAAMGGDDNAKAILDNVYAAAEGGDKNAVEAAKRYREVVIRHSVPRAPAENEVGFHEDAAREIGVDDSVEGVPMSAFDRQLRRKWRNELAVYMKAG